MFSQQEVELLTKVGPGTAMGALFRRYWMPALLSEEIPEPNCAPVTVRLLGEELVAFRDSFGRVGLLEEHCSHRRASLYYGRNEDGGLRCAYHGWKYDVEGNVLDTPAEPPESNLKYKVHHTAYPCREAAGMVFTYMGPKDKAPGFPRYEWLLLPPEHVIVTKIYQECNYLQALDGDCDPSHLPFLHRGNVVPNMEHYTHPPISSEVIETLLGINSVVKRRVGKDRMGVRVSNFVMPFLGLNPVGMMIDGKLDGYLIVYQVPQDDYHTCRYHVRFMRSQPLPEEERESDHSQVGADYRVKGQRDGRYFVVDRIKQRNTNFTGLDNFIAQDVATIEGMGPVSDRTKEHLGLSDTYVIAVRRFLLNAIRSFLDGGDPPGINVDDHSEINCTMWSYPSEKD